MLAPPISPVSLTNKNLGGGDFFYDPGTGAGQIGVEDGVGVNNIGLLVKTCGTVTAVGATLLLHRRRHERQRLFDIQRHPGEKVPRLCHLQATMSA
jgi:hypothetical protein